MADASRANLAVEAVLNCSLQTLEGFEVLHNARVLVHGAILCHFSAVIRDRHGLYFFLPWRTSDDGLDDSSEETQKL